ncbi:MAG TPA: hypothetical protein VMK66_10545 [Myxococcales bacterium]|nr:hypothetical protein [Myxococcales bacterium]
MTFRAREPYGLLVAELARRAAESDCALRASIAMRRVRHRAVNAIFARVIPQSAQAPRTRAWLADTLAS